MVKDGTGLKWKGEDGTELGRTGQDETSVSGRDETKRDGME